jgi:hypothetical protein
MADELTTFFAVLSMRKIKTMAGVLNVVKHNLRQKIIEQKDYIDHELSILNEYTGAQTDVDFERIYKERIENAHLKRKIQSNASRILEFVFSFSAGFSKGW